MEAKKQKQGRMKKAGEYKSQDPEESSEPSALLIPCVLVSYSSL
jgi:hypothetical protein